MCGIIGIIGTDGKYENISQMLLNRIKRLEYRGYDSVGLAVINNDIQKIQIKKDIGDVDEVDRKHDLGNMKGKIGIAHSRWATCGAVNRNNAHPHHSCDKKIAIVHNGIIRNHQKIKKELEKKGHVFESETDSEVIAHFFEDKLKEKDINNTCRDFFDEIEGEFATLIIQNDDDRIIALRRDSPLVLGITEDCNILASDIYAFSDITSSSIFFENDEFAIVTEDDYEFYDKNGKKIEKIITEIDWTEKSGSEKKKKKKKKKKFEHFMIKEIMEQPIAAKRLINSLKNEQKDTFNELISTMRHYKNIKFTACGTSYYASLLGVYYLHKCKVDSQTIIASEFDNFTKVDRDTLVISISQSGETMDVIEALKYSKKKGAKIASIINVPHSTIQRFSDISLNICAGQEIAVAGTKSFLNPTILLLEIAKRFGFRARPEDLPEMIRDVLSIKEKIKQIAKQLKDKNDLYVIGRGMNYPIAREFALKIKEISYIHAEGMMGGELKHGTIALIEEGTPVISLICNNEKDMITNTEEVEARGAKVIRITNRPNADIKIKTDNEGKFAILSTIVGQLLAYYLAYEKGLPIDKPRNLAKSVTVK